MTAYMSENCKQVFISIAVLAILGVIFSASNFPAENETPKGTGMQYRGDSGTVVPGNGADPVGVIMPESLTKSEETDEAMSDVASEEIHEEVEEEQKIMDGWIHAFWHGVVAVLIGEASALVVAFVWMKIRGGK